MSAPVDERVAPLDATAAPGDDALGAQWSLPGADASSAAVPTDEEMAELFSRAQREVERERVIVGWLNEGQSGRSWRARTRRGLRNADLLDKQGRPLYGDALRERLETLDAGYRPQVWWSSREWLGALAEVLRSEEGRAICRGADISVDAVETIARCMAARADRRTGRSLTASKEVIAADAGRSVSMVKRARRALRRLELIEDRTHGRNRLTALEAQAAREYHGGEQRAIAGELILVVPTVRAARDGNADAPAVAPVARAAEASAPASAEGADGAGETSGEASDSEIVRVSTDPLSVGTHLSSSSSVRRNSPSARARARATKSRPPTAKSTPAKRRSTNRHQRPVASLAIQQLAAGIVHPVTGISGLKAAYGPESGRHIGEVVQVLLAAGIDPNRWSAQDVKTALSASFEAENRTWITDPVHPARWLRWALGRIDFTATSPSEAARARADVARIPDRVVVDARERSQREPASAQTRTAAREQLMRNLRERQERAGRATAVDAAAEPSRGLSLVGIPTGSRQRSE